MSLPASNPTWPVAIRPARPEEYPAIVELLRQAFETPHEAEVVRQLWESRYPHISLVAEVDDAPVGHIFFTPVTIESGYTAERAMGLGPLGVRPEYQGQGIGSALVRAGLEACRARGEEVVFVLGPPDFYRRFGFVPCRRYDLHYPDRNMDPYFLVQELMPGGLSGAWGVVRYHPAFDDV